ncbi:MAG: VanW family protein [Spirochaetes bacterium]|nr:VanW family protein [Spirochaetota bacterium]
MRILLYIPFPALLLALLCRISAPPAAAQPADITVISSFTTSVAEQDDNVKRNIHLACLKLQGVQIGPGERFSFNATVGEAGAAQGFVDGRVLYMDTVVYEAGGGLCQVSSTLYNAMLLAGFAIVTRHRHFQPVTYVPPGLDATIKYGKKDLVMRNPHDMTVRIDAAVEGGSLVVKLLAPRPLGFQYDMALDEEELEIPFAQEEDGSRIRNGLSVYVYRIKMRDRKVLERQLLYKDYYPPVRFR